MDSNSDQLDELQDILTFFIKYENRHSIKNTLALVDPVSCKVTKVVTNNVTIDLEQEDFIESKEKVPVYVDSQEKVKFLYQSGDAIMTGSDWIANALLFTGQTLAKSISSGSRFLEEKIEPNTTCFKLSEQDKDIVDMVYNATHTVTSIASDVMNKALDVAASGLRTIEPKTAHAHFGWSALKATATLIGGVTAAASVVLDSSREGIVQIVRKKYGDDAGYVAEKTVGTVSHVADLLVYFDAKGISRRVVLGGLAGLNQTRQEEREVVFDHSEEAVVKR